ncbi:hypothetical protein CERSUDRAFT_110773 [Gelatoporia subvermispora B]|uniref:Uncharacterized protein n=1 Tax=Ceriporiopsis subvermispora (strain B) TaxID=914234 RepID=M2RUU9_CERS8|nr:hypothetical protein CERSUDRAFT_110773 [Gelatoporia subvermispora B]
MAESVELAVAEVEGATVVEAFPEGNTSELGSAITATSYASCAGGAGVFGGLTGRLGETGSPWTGRAGADAGIWPTGSPAGTTPLAGRLPPTGKPPPTGRPPPAPKGPPGTGTGMPGTLGAPTTPGMEGALGTSPTGGAGAPKGTGRAGGAGTGAGAASGAGAATNA